MIEKRSVEFDANRDGPPARKAFVRFATQRLIRSIKLTRKKISGSYCERFRVAADVLPERLDASST